jgi:hypothetical protein
MAKLIEAKEQHSTCDVCGRTMLKGERADPYLLPSRERRLVCELCAPRAQQEGWIHESAAPDTPVQPPRSGDRGKLFKRRRRRPLADGTAGEQEGSDASLATASERIVRRPPRREGQREPAPAATKMDLARDPRHVRAVPTNAELKIGRAIDLFNATEHPRTVAGIARSLGSPRVSASTSDASAAEVLLTIAWELSWYQFSVDLSDTNEPVRVRGRGAELEELPDEVHNWNAHAEPDGSIALGPSESLNGERPAQRI